MVEFPDIKESIEDELENILNKISQKHNIDISILLEKHLPSRSQNTKSKKSVGLKDELEDYRRRKQIEWEILEKEEEEKEAEEIKLEAEKQKNISERRRELYDKLCKLYTDPIVIEQEFEYAIEHGI